MIDCEQQAHRDGFNLTIGIDEAGRGPLAGPVVAAAVSLRQKDFITKIKDSKLMTAAARERAFEEIFQKAYVGIGVISEVVIDQKNILEATFFAMHNAVLKLLTKLPISLKEQKNFTKKVCLLVDGPHFKTDLPYSYRTIVGGDKSILPIACASIVAKVTRDRILEKYDRIFPQYGFKQHKGYPTVAHKQAIKRFGPTMIHRKSFCPSLYI